MTTPTTALARELVQMACYAPSVHNTQPWAWRLVDAETIELHADRSRQLPTVDPRGRDLALSCGAALHHLTAAAEAFGLVAKVTLLPDRRQPDLLARIGLSEGETTERAVEVLTALENRMTDRRGFTSWQVPPSRLEHLAEVASQWGAHVVSLTDPHAVATTEHLLERARQAQLSDPHVVEEQDRWVERPTADGVPARSAVPRARTGVQPRPDRFNTTSTRPVEDRDEEGHPDALLVVCTARDDLRSWLQAGQTLSALWLRATLEGLALTPLSQVIEVEKTRRALRRDVFDGMARPQIVVRIGWPEAARPQLERSPRRSLSDVLLP